MAGLIASANPTQATNSTAPATSSTAMLTPTNPLAAQDVSLAVQQNNPLQWAPLAPATPGSNNIPVAQATPGSATASTVDLNAPQLTIAGDIGKYMDPNSQTNQMLRTKALEAANQTGTANSSMTDSAISNGIIANAQGMAQADQGIYSQGANTNANLLTSTSNNNAQLTNQTNIANMQASNQAALEQAQLQSQQLIAGMSNQNQVALTGLQNQNKTLLQGSSVALNSYQSLLQQIGAIQQNASLDPATRANMIQSLINETGNALQGQSSLIGLNIGSNYNGLTASTGSTGAANISA